VKRNQCVRFAIVKIRYLAKPDNLAQECHLTEGRIYPVLALWIDLSSKVSTAVVLPDNARSPIQISSPEFEVVEHSIPQMWRIEIDLALVLMAPNEWKSQQFWRDLFNRVPEAICTFERVLPELYQELTGELLPHSRLN